MKSRKKQKQKQKRNNKSKKRNAGSIVIKSTTPKRIMDFTNSIPNGRSGGPPIMSYRPSINKILPRLTSLTPKAVSHHDCFTQLEKKASISLTQNESTPAIDYPTPQIAMPECVKLTSARAQKILIENARSTKLIPASKITAPLQYLSNCWFNSGFMAMFISDKGRDFNRSFRQSMIEGKIIGKGGKRTDIPPKLRNALGYFAIAIDACLRGDPIMHKLNTNHLLLSIYKAIPKSKLPKDIKETTLDEAGNPIPYYNGLYTYLYGNKSGSFPVKFVELYGIRKGLPSDKKTFKYLFEKEVLELYKKESSVQSISEIEPDSLPDLFMVEIYNSEKEERDFEDPSKVITEKPEILKINGVSYKLDATVCRDTKNTHMCATLTYGGKQYGFDGESLHRMDPFKWKGYINKNKNWTFKGSIWKGAGLPGKSGSSVYWNYRDGYHALYYYRVTPK